MIEDVDFDTDPEAEEISHPSLCAFDDAVLQMKGYDNMVRYLTGMDDAVEALKLLDKEIAHASKLNDSISKLYVEKLVKLRQETPGVITIAAPLRTAVGTLYRQVSPTELVEVR